MRATSKGIQDSAGRINKSVGRIRKTPGCRPGNMIWLADLNPSFDNATGKTQPVVIVQTDLLNKFHFATVIRPITTKVKSNVKILRVHLSKRLANLKEDFDIMIDQSGLLIIKDY